MILIVTYSWGSAVGSYCTDMIDIQPKAEHLINLVILE